MAVIQATPSDFAASLATVHAGDTLQLAPGNYGSLNLAHLHFTTAVTIKGGTFSNIVIGDVSGVKLDSATINFVPDAATTANSQAVRIWSSYNITISHSTIHGGVAVNGVDPNATALDATGNVLGLPTAKAINVDFSQHVTLSGNDISTFAKGIVFNDAKGLTISSNTIHDLRTTPISGSVLSGLRITGNHTWDSHPWHFGDGGTGDHGDRIHIWTDNVAATGVFISNNRLEQGAGDPMLGIYLDDNGKGLGFKNAIIAHNTVIDATGQGLLLENVSGMVIDNTLQWSGTGDAYHDKPRIQISGGSHDIQFIGNAADVGLAAGVHDLSFFDETGVFMSAAALTVEARLSIHVGTGDHAAALAAVGLNTFGGAALTADAHATLFAGYDLIGSVASVNLHPLSVIA